MQVAERSNPAVRCRHGQASDPSSNPSADLVPHRHSGGDGGAGIHPRLGCVELAAIARRTAEAAGASAAVIPERRAAQVTATVMRVSAGAAVFLPVARVTNLGRSVQRAKEAGFWIIGLDAEGKQVVPRAGDDPRLGDRIGLVIGAEGEGMHRLVAEYCDELARLPMRGRVESLNASVAAGLAIYRLLDGSLFGNGGPGPRPACEN